MKLYILYKIENKKLRELSKDFLKSNVVYYSISYEGEIVHKFKNGKTRKIDLFKSNVEMIGNNGKELYSNILNRNHPLMMCAILYYK